MTQYSPGELANFQFIDEATYGVTPETALTWGGILTSAKPKVNANQDFIYGSTNRGYSDAVSGTWEIGLTLKGLARVAQSNYHWYNFWWKYGLGSTTSATEHLPSFSLQINFAIGTGYVYWLFNGCKIDKLKLSSEGHGLPIEFEAEIMSQWVSKSTTKAITGFQTITIGSDGSAPTSDLLTWTEPIEVKLGTAAPFDMSPKKWELTIDNDLARTPGIIEGADAAYYNCVSALSEGKREVEFQCTLDLEDERYNTAKLAEDNFLLHLPIDTQILSAPDGTILVGDDDLPEFKRDHMEQTLKARMMGISCSDA